MQAMKPFTKSLFVSVLLSAIILSLKFTFCEAAGLNADPIQTTASVSNQLTLNVRIFDGASGAEIPSLDFGELQISGDELKSNRYFKVLLQASAQGESYEITHQASDFVRSGGTETIPAGALAVEPYYSAAENGGAAIPLGAKIASSGPAKNVPVVFSDPSGSSRVISMLYTLSSKTAGSTEKIPVNQRSGAYSGTIRYTLTTS